MLKDSVVLWVRYPGSAEQNMALQFPSTLCELHWPCRQTMGWLFTCIRLLMVLDRPLIKPQPFDPPMNYYLESSSLKIYLQPHCACSWS